MSALHIPRPAAVIFDMDGLLLDSERVALELLAASAQQLGLDWNEDAGLGMVGLNLPDSTAHLVQHFGADYPVGSLRARFDELYHQAIIGNAIAPKPFALDLLAHLNTHHIPCAVATSTRRSRAELKLLHAKMHHYFKAIACGDEVMRGKPSPDIFVLAASRVGAQPSRCLALEDSNAGVRAAVSAGMTVVMVPDMVKADAGIKMMGVPCVSSLKLVLSALNQ